jgi:collagen type VI alpha
VIVITDGESNVNAQATIPEAELAREQDIHIMSIGINVADEWELNGIANKPAFANVFNVQSYLSLWNISENLVKHVCRANLYCETNPCKNGGTCIAGPAGYMCECLPGFLGSNCETECSTRMDITFILDTSASVGYSNFDIMLKFVSGVIKDLSGYGTDNKFALITFSSKVQTVFSFNRYDRAEDIMTAVETTVYKEGATYTSGALRQAIQMYTPEFGDRPNAQNLVILFTDGLSNINFPDTIPAANDLKTISGAKITCIGIALQDNDEVNSIASSKKDVYEVGSFSEIKTVKNLLMQRTCAASLGN